MYSVIGARGKSKRRRVYVFVDDVSCEVREEITSAWSRYQKQ